MVFTFFKGLFKKTQKTNKEKYATETGCGQQGLRYLLSGPSQKKFADPWIRARFASTGCLSLPFAGCVTLGRLLACAPVSHLYCRVCVNSNDWIVMMIKHLFT